MRKSLTYVYTSSPTSGRVILFTLLNSYYTKENKINL